MIQALLLDFDGLILDTETPELELWSNLFTHHGQTLSVDEWVRSVVGSGFDTFNPLDVLARLSGVNKDQLAVELQQRRLQLQKQPLNPPLPGVRELLEQAPLMGLRLAIVSSSKHEWVDRALQQLDLLDFFEVIICREDAPRVKPEPDLYLAALRALQLRPRQAVAFEDSPNGVRAAANAGLKVVGVPNHITARLGPLDSDLLLDSLSALPLPGLLAALGDALVLRPERREDFAGIQTVEEAAFTTPLEAHLVELVRERGKAVLSMVGVIDGSVAGHVLFTPVYLDDHPDNHAGLGLGPVAVQPGLQRVGIGSRLMRAGLWHVRQAGYGFVVLLGDPGYYRRFGFQPGHAFSLDCKYTDGDEFQALELQPGALENISGMLRYIPEFDEAGA